MSYIITDGHGYVAGKLHRPHADKSKVVSLWSANIKDAARYHFLAVAESIAKATKNPDARAIPHDD